MEIKQHLKNFKIKRSFTAPMFMTDFIFLMIKQTLKVGSWSELFIRILQINSDPYGFGVCLADRNFAK